MKKAVQVTETKELEVRYHIHVGTIRVTVFADKLTGMYFESDGHKVYSLDLYNDGKLVMTTTRRKLRFFHKCVVANELILSYELVEDKNYEL